MKATRKICKTNECKQDPKMSSLFCEEHASDCNLEIPISNGKTELDSSNSFHVEEIIGCRFNKKKQSHTNTT